MPTRRRNISKAAALPASRLPVGTRPLSLRRSPPTSGLAAFEERTSPNALIEPSNVHGAFGLPSSTETSGNDKGSQLVVMAESGKADSVPTVSRAEAKLARQNKRIQQAEAALAAPLPLDSERQNARGKTKVWKPFDLAAGSTHPDNAEEGGVPVSEVRVNTFRPATRDSSISRSMSSLSHRTTNTGTSEVERHDSFPVEGGGFQLFTGRKNRRSGDQLSAYNDKPEERQTTVEATFDEREIYLVFGNALPAPGFIEQNIGAKDGELKFVQHPNGDVSAHQWSEKRYIWENIGQFSNIRKKVEGQLAADRLKGETASQTLQHNTLAYFRTIAKQREANILGLPFGPKEIQAAMPDLRQPPAASTTPRTTTAAPPEQETSLPPSVQTKPGDPEPSVNEPRNPSGIACPTPIEGYVGGYVPYGSYGGTGYSSVGSQYGTHGIYGSQYQPNVAPAMFGQLHDPFYSTNSRSSLPLGLGAMHAGYGSFSTTTSGYGQQNSATDKPQMSYDYHFPPPGATLRAPSQARDVVEAGNRPQLQSRASSAANHALWQRSTESNLFPTVALPNAPSTGVDSMARQQRENSITRPDIAPRTITGHAREAGGPMLPKRLDSVYMDEPQLKPVSPFSARNAMRDQVLKLGNQAKERSLSQANFRTVMYDPFQSQPISTSNVAADLSPRGESPQVYKTVANPTGQLPTQRRSLRHGLSTQASTPTSGVQREAPDENLENLKVSTPDCAAMSLSYITSSSEKPTPQTLKGPFFRATASGLTKTHTTSRKAIDDELKDWWTSGNKFRRQEEFYQSIRPSAASRTTDHSSPALIGTPAKNSQTARDGTQDPMTRLLIPVLENLASYVQGPIDRRRDYFARWTQPPEWCVDRSPNGNNSFFDGDWGQPPARVGRDPRYRPLTVESVRFGGFGSPQSGGSGSGGGGGSLAVGGGVAGLDRRFAFGVGR